jgi:hypothetical protein
MMVMPREFHGMPATTKIAGCCDMLWIWRQILETEVLTDPETASRVESTSCNWLSQAAKMEISDIK